MNKDQVKNHVCQQTKKIKDYWQEQKELGRGITLDQAALEWIQKFAKHFSLTCAETDILDALKELEIMFPDGTSLNTHNLEEHLRHCKGDLRVSLELLKSLEEKEK